MGDQVVIDRRFSGPPDSGHGGYVCGLVASRVGSAAEITLRRPPPLGRPLTVTRSDDGGVDLLDGAMLVARGVPAAVELDVPAPVTYADATQAATSYFALARHVFPTCFACGPERAEGDGLRIFSGRVAGRDVVAAPWTPDASLLDGAGHVRPEFVWAALDCPGGHAVIAFLAEPKILLGRLAATLAHPVPAQGRYVLVGWLRGADGRKLYAGSALFSDAGGLHAAAKQVWIKPG